MQKCVVGLLAGGKVFNPIPIAFHLVVGKPLIEESSSLYKFNNLASCFGFRLDLSDVLPGGERFSQPCICTWIGECQNR